MFSGLPISPLIDTPVPPPARNISGFWGRLLAFIVDGIVVSLPCFVLGSVFYSFFSNNPRWAMLVGFAIALPYFAVMGSSLKGGQTIGQRLTQIQVVDRAGLLLPVSESIIRYLILLGPLMLTADLLPTWTPSAITTGFNNLIGLAEFGIVYLYLFNNNTRQSLHDLATAAFVVDDPGTGHVDAPPLWRGHWAVLAAVVALLLAGSFAVPWLTHTESFSELTSVQTGVAQLPDVSNVEVTLQKSTSSRGQVTTGVLVSVTRRQGSADEHSIATKVATAVIQSDPHARELDLITVNFVEGFTIGFARFHSRHQIGHSPDEWEKMSSNGMPAR
jgi:uncharacterized RDD family membrane protein YckC